MQVYRLEFLYVLKLEDSETQRVFIYRVWLFLCVLDVLFRSLLLVLHTNVGVYVSFAPWCPACKSLIPTWDKLGQRSFDLDMNFAKIDVTENAGIFIVLAINVLTWNLEAALCLVTGNL